MKIVSAKIEKIGRGKIFCTNNVIATFEDGHIEKIFNYYPNEISFTPNEFIGKTKDECFDLFYKKDMEYLKS